MYFPISCAICPGVNKTTSEYVHLTPVSGYLILCIALWTSLNPRLISISLIPNTDAVIAAVWRHLLNGEEIIFLNPCSINSCDASTTNISPFSVMGGS